MKATAATSTIDVGNLTVTQGGISVVGAGTSVTKLAVRPGTSAVLATAEAASLAEINPAQLICYRKTRSLNIGNGMQVFHSEFAFPSAVAAVRPLQCLLQSKNKMATQVAERMVKTAAIIASLQTSSESYRQALKGSVATR